MCCIIPIPNGDRTENHQPFIENTRLHTVLAVVGGVLFTLGVYLLCANPYNYAALEVGSASVSIGFPLLVIGSIFLLYNGCHSKRTVAAESAAQPMPSRGGHRLGSEPSQPNNSHSE